MNKKYVIDIPEDAVCNRYSITIKTDSLIPYASHNPDKAWDLAYEILDMSEQERMECFGYELLSRVLTGFSYDEAKEKYEYYMNKQIRVGDEITDGEATGYVMWIGNGSFLVKLDVYEFPQDIRLNNHNFRKTGKHNSKLAEAMGELS